MTLTHELYDELLAFDQDSTSKDTISKMYTAPKGAQLVYALAYYSRLRQLYFKSEQATVDDIPQCNGIEIKKVELKEYSQNDFFIELSQNKDSDAEIFEVIVEDIRRCTDELQNEHVVNEVVKILRKWKSFFAQQKIIIMSEERQQGLFGELLFLNYLIDEYGTSAVFFWAGCKYETHDFYINKSAVEVKTTSTKAPYKMHISSEYQLDMDDVSKQLFVAFYAFRKSESDGKKLPEIVNEIRDKIDTNIGARNRFDECLEEYGYFDGLEERYSTGYIVRENFYYYVTDCFPRITKEMLLKGVTNCQYDVLSDVCTSFLIEKQDLFRQIKEN